MIFYWRLGSEEGKAKLKELPQLETMAREFGNKADDYLVEIIDAVAQKTAGVVLLETGNGSFDVGGGASAGNWLVIRDSTGRALVYSIKGGDLRNRFFGGIVAINPGKNQIALQNLPGEISLYNLDAGDRQAAFVINGRAVFFKFNPEGDSFFILSDTQSAYAFDLNRVAAKPAAQTI